MRIFKNLGTVFFIIMLTLAFDSIAYSQQLKLSLEEIAQNADLIFVGTVERQTARVNKAQTMVFTDVLFKDIRIVHGTKKSVQKGSSGIRLTYAGGKAGNINVEVGHPPSLLPGHRYLIFMLDDGHNYANPILGGDQGVFEVLTDGATAETYLQKSSGKVIVGVDGNGIQLSKNRVSGIKAGRMIVEQARDASSDGFFNEAATPADRADSTSVYNPGLEAEKQSSPLSLTDFLNFITTKSLKKPITNDRLKRTGPGVFYKRNGDQMEAEPLQLQTREPSKLPLTEDTSLPPSFSVSTGAKDIDNIRPLAGTVGACGYHTLPLVMEQVPTTFWSYSIVNDNMFAWNQPMDVFRFLESDGTWANNTSNEFGGFVDSDTLYSIYEFRWEPGVLAVTVSYKSSADECSRITQADVFWNPSLSWTDDANFAIGNPNVFLLRLTNQHETGHVWGLQRGPFTETYEYDVPTVMQGYNPFIVEDGRGIHRVDAYLIRRQYQNQTGILAKTDVGVESYYALEGSNNSTTNASTYAPGQSITLNDVTVENMSFSSVSDMRLRFYLSTDRTISTNDYQLGSYWFWEFFPGESYRVDSYSTTIPTNVPAGQYYVIALITINGFGIDDYTHNNSTSFYSRISIGGTPPSNGGGSAGLYNPSTSTFFLKNTNSGGGANLTFSYGPAGAGWTPLAGDWDGNGTDTAGLYNPSTSTFFLRNSNSQGAANTVFAFGPAGSGWIPLVGDWDGNGTDTVGLYNPSTSMFFLKNINSAGAANVTFSYGPAGAGWTPVVGDWDGNGVDTVGLYNPSTSMFFLTNAHSAGAAGIVFSFGPAGAGWKPLVGDWDGNGADTVGLYNPSTSMFFLKNINSAGAANVTFSYGPAGAGWTPLMGNWDGL